MTDNTISSNITSTDINTNVTVPTTEKVEQHVKFLTWLHSLNSEKILDCASNFVIPAIEVALPLVGVNVGKPQLEVFYKMKYLLGLYETWKQHENNGVNTIETKQTDTNLIDK